MTFENALAKTLGFEGGISNHPLDGGGLTKWGITQRTYDNYRVTTGRTKQSVTEMSDVEMRAIYRDNYWDAINAEDLRPDLAEAVFDMAVNSGVAAAKRTLQRAAGVHVDGVIGPQTIQAAKGLSVLVFLKRRAGFYQDVIRNNPSQIEFMEGWVNRLLEQAWRT